MDFVLSKIKRICTFEKPPLKPVYEAVLFHLYKLRQIKYENLLILKFNESYYEYVKFINQDGVFEIQYQYFHDKPYTYEQLLRYDGEILKSEPSLTLKYIDDLSYISKSPKYYHDTFHDNTDFLLLNTIPFEIRVCDNEKTLIRFSKYGHIPHCISTKLENYLFSNAVVYLLFNDQSVSKTLGIGLPKMPELKISIDVDSYFRVIFSIKNNLNRTLKQVLL